MAADPAGATDNSGAYGDRGRPRSFMMAWANAKTIATDINTLVRLYVQLAKTELRSSAKALGLAIAMSLVAIGLILLAALFLLIALAYVLVAIGLPAWAGFLIVAGAVLVIVAVLGLLAKSQFKKVTLPDRTLAALGKPTSSASDAD